MTDQWQDIPIGNVRVGDEVRIDGMGRRGSEFVDWDGEWSILTAVGVGARKAYVYVSYEYQTVFRRSSIVAARRKVEQPRVGEWRCPHGMHHIGPTRKEARCGMPEVYRSTGWSKDTRKVTRRQGGARKFEIGEYVELVTPLRICGTSDRDIQIVGGWIGVDRVRHIERRKEDRRTA